MKNNAIFTSFVFLFIGIGLIVRNYLYAPVEFYDWDEGIYAQVGWELFENKTLQTTFNDEIWLNKPPLSHGLVALALGFFDRSEVAARMVMVFFGIAQLVITYLLARKLMRILYPEALNKMGSIQREFVYLLPVLALASTPLFIERSIVLNTDVMLGIGWSGFFLASTFVPKLLFLSFGVLSKSIVGLYPLCVGLFELSKKQLSFSNIWKGLLLVLLPLVWHITSYIRFGEFFLQAHLFDQVVKRVVSPIELHFGTRMYYLALLWENLSILTVFAALGLGIVTFFCLKLIFTQYASSKKISFLWAYFVIALLIGVFFVIPGPTTNSNLTVAALGGTVIVLLHLFWKKKYAPEDPKALSAYLVLLSPVPFFLLLMMSQSKIGWYLVTLLPLIVLSLSFLYMSARFAFIRLPLLLITVAIFLVQFVPNTYGFKVNHTPNERLILARCIEQQKPKEMAVLVDAQERQNRLVLESLQLQTATSFTYGGSPSFVFYAQKDIEFFYGVEDFTNRYTDFPLLMVSTGDVTQIPEQYAIIQEGYTPVCRDNNWIVFERN